MGTTQRAVKIILIIMGKNRWGVNDKGNEG